jgi:Raf kinase inhibitor-like YbhB/YbcL family protein
VTGTRSGRGAALLAAVGCLVVAACSGSDSSDTPEPSADTSDSSITVTSDAFGDGDAIPVEFSCDGSNTSPALSWSGVPATADALALVLADPDAPSGTFYHWVVADIPTTINSVDAGGTPEGGVVAQNSAGDPAYMGPCPPSGTHHYRFTVYALSERTGISADASTDDALSAIDAVADTAGTLTGTYTRD